MFAQKCESHFDEILRCIGRDGAHFLRQLDSLTVLIQIRAANLTPGDVLLKAMPEMLRERSIQIRNQKFIDVLARKHHASA